MNILILLFFINGIILRKYEKGKEHLFLFLHALLLLILSYYQDIFLIQIMRIIFCVSFTIFLVLHTIFPYLQSRKIYKILVILGCGLLDGQHLSYLLKDRCDLGFILYQNKVLVSGGKGKDEIISEASAMKEYLLLKGIPQEDILCEEQSKSTFENLVYTKEMIGNDFMIVTSDFHRLRVYLLAKHLKLNCTIYTCKSIYYYKGYALLREYYAIFALFVHYVMKNKKI